MLLIFISTYQHKLNYYKKCQQTASVYVSSSQWLASRCYSEFTPSKEYIIKANQIRLKGGALCDKVPDGMIICCQFLRRQGIVDTFDDGCGF